MTLLGWPEPAVRFTIFFGLLMLLMATEWLWPRRKLRLGRIRWPCNLAIMALGAVVVRLMATVSLPLVAVSAALWAQQAQIGLLHMLHLPPWLAFTLALLALDALVWAQHLSFHRIAFFWRFHRVHHADQDIDVSTALRFHPAEIAVSMLIKVAAVLLLGAPIEAVIVFEIALNGCAMFNHANLRLPLALDRALRLLIVTADMHRVHHSVYANEHNRNFGFCLSLWDRLFNAYLAQPRNGHAAMQIGLPEYQGTGPAQLSWCLRLPAAPLQKRPEITLC